MNEPKSDGAPSEPTGCCGVPETTETAACRPPAGGSGVEITLDSLTSRATDDAATSCCAPKTQESWLDQLRSRLWSAWSLIALIPLMVWVLDPGQLGEVLGIASSALLNTAPYILVAVMLIAYLKASGAEGVIGSAFAGRENRMIVVAALVGGLAPFCSCEVIPFVAGLLAVGVPVSAVMAFWLSSPLIDPPSLLITAGALGWDFAIGKAAAAVFLGLFGGFGVRLLLRQGAFTSPLKKPTTASCSTGGCGTGEIERPLWVFWNEKRRSPVFRDALFENVVFLFKWLSLAYLLEALLILYIPASLIGQVVGGEEV